MSCPICHDTGWEAVDREGVRRVVRCQCWRERQADRYLEAARIPARYAHCDLENFHTHNDAQIAAAGGARRFAQAFPLVDRGLLLIGPPGIGKTHLAVAVLKLVVRTRSARGLFYDTRDLLRVIRSTYDPVVRTTEIEVLRPVMEAELLVLDDLGAEKTSEWVEETLNLIVNTRYNEKRPTIFTTNYDDRDPENLDSLPVRVGFRMMSRLHEMCEFLHIEGPDHRVLPPDPRPEDIIKASDRRRQAARKLPGRTGGPIRAQLRDPGPADLKWPGGKVNN